MIMRVILIRSIRCGLIVSCAARISIRSRIVIRIRTITNLSHVRRNRIIVVCLVALSYAYGFVTTSVLCIVLICVRECICIVLVSISTVQ